MNPTKIVENITNKTVETRIVEGSAILIDVGDVVGRGIATKKQNVFYNPVMKHQRDIFVAVVNSAKFLPDRELHVGLPMEASGVRAIRLIKECNARRLLVSANDMSKSAVDTMVLLAAENKVSFKSVTQLASDVFFSQSSGFDIIDIDPFGSPGPFLDAAIKRMSRNGLLCVTATDTAPLCGLFPDVCLRKYWAKSSRDPAMHEWAVRILVRYCQMIGAQHDRALLPILCYKKDHYVRLYFYVKKSKELATQIFDNFGTVYVNQKTNQISLKSKKEFECVGPIYIGSLVDVSKFDEAKFRAVINDSFVDTLFTQTKDTSSVVGYYNIPSLCSIHKIKIQPSVDEAIDSLKKAKYFVSVSLDESQSIKTNCSYKKMIYILNNISKKKEIVVK